MNPSTRGKHAAAAPARRGAPRRGGRGLVLGILAVVVAAIVASPALVALAAPQAVRVEVEALSTVAYDDPAAQIYGNDASFKVKVTLSDGRTFDTTKSAVTASAGGLAVVQSWAAETSADAEDGTSVYACTVKVSESTNNTLQIAVASTDAEGAAVMDSWTYGNSASMSNTKPITVDKSAPQVSIKMSGARIGFDENVDYYGDERLTATVTVSDPTFDQQGSTVNGKAVTWVSTGSGAFTASVDCSDEDTSTLSVVAKDKLSHQETAAYGPTTTTDANGTAVQGTSFAIETNIPTIEFELSEGAETTGYYRDSAAVTVTVEMKRWGSVEGLDGWTETTDETNPSKHVFTKTFTDEGLHEVSVSAKNKGIFQPQYSNKTSFTIDRTAPTMSVSFDNNNAVNGNYYDEARTATITVSEALGFDPELVEVKVNGEAQPCTWSETNPHTATVSFATDGDYELTVSGKDKSGNTMVMVNNPSATEYESGEFTIDTTDPAVAFSYDNNDVANGSYYDAARTATITLSETNFDEQQTVVKVNGEEQDVTWASDGGQHTATLPAFDQDGRYVITVETTDRANRKKSFTSEESVIDLKDPQIELTWNNAGSEGESTYFDGGRVATITVIEENFEGDLIDIDTNGAQGTWKSDGDVHTMEVSFVEDGSYHLTVSGSDLAGRTAEPKASGDFVVDTTAPVLDVTFADGDAAADSDGQTAYYAAARTATVTVSELNFDPERVVIETGNAAATVGSWKDEGATHTLEVAFPESSESYDLKVSVSDRAGNAGVDAEGKPFAYESGAFVVDETAPVVSIALDQAKVQTYGGVDYFAAAPTATITVSDVNFKPSASTVSVEGGTIGAWQEVSCGEDGVVTWQASVTFAEGTGRNLVVRAVDWASHAADGAYGTDTTDASGAALLSPTFTVDLTAPVVTAARLDQNPSNSYASEHYFFDASTALTISLSDNIGIESLSVVDNGDDYYARASEIEPGATEAEITLAFADGHDFDRAITVRTIDLAHNYRYWSISPTGEVRAANESDLSNKPVFGDGTYPQSLLQDTVFPNIALAGVEAGSYYNAAQRVTLTVDELNLPYVKTYDPDQAVLSVRRVSGDASAAVSEWSRPASNLAVTGAGALSFSDSQGSHSYDLYGLAEDLAADGHYTVSAQFQDPAGNRTTAEIGEFTVDQTAPVVDVSFDNNDVRNGKYYNASRTATVTVTEHNFDPSLVSIETNGSVGAWSTSGDTHTAQVSFSADGVYNLSVSGQDRAGNAMEPYQADEFVVDTEAPTITFGGVEDASAYNDVVAPAISFVDEANFDAAGTSYTVTGTKNGVVSYDASVVAEGQGETVSFADFARDASVDDIYTITAQMSDLAGNSAEESVTFSVNRFGSTFRVVDAGLYEENDGYLTERRDVVVEEINVSGVASEEHGVTVTEGTTVSELTLNEASGDDGYTIEADTSAADDSNGWSVYLYRIAAGNFERDGRYHVSVQSNDLADNTNTSSSYYDRSTGGVSSAEVDFILDTTDPVITNLSVADGQTYETSVYEGSFTVVENIGIRDVEVLVDGERVEAIDDGYGTYTFEITSASFTPRSLSVTATDLSGRVGTAAASGFHVTTDILELHLPWVIAGAVAVVAVAGGAFYLFVVRRKKDDEKTGAAA